MGEIVDVDAPGCHVRGDKKAGLPLLDLAHDLLSLVLGKIGRQLVGIVAKALQHAGNVVHVGLGIAEDDG